MNTEPLTRQEHDQRLADEAVGRFEMRTSGYPVGVRPNLNAPTQVKYFCHNCDSPATEYALGRRWCPSCLDEYDREMGVFLNTPNAPLQHELAALTRKPSPARPHEI